MQVHTVSLAHATVQAAMLALAAVLTVRGQPGNSGLDPGLLIEGGGLVNLTAGNPNVFVIAAVDDGNNTVGATTAGSDTIDTTSAGMPPSIVPTATYG